MEDNVVYLSIGTNIGDRLSNIEYAHCKIDLLVGKLLQKSSIYSTEPWGFASQDYFYNQVISLRTKKQPSALLDVLLTIESGLGRVRSFKNAPRILDIDILFFGDEIILDGDLLIPHPRLHLRNFILIPMAEIAGNFIHPVYKKTINELLQQTTDQSTVHKLKYHDIKSE
jgi:2-amino-4-hydroxy-6-hydroxymethyldihydropteridine diphosphokinase